VPDTKKNNVHATLSQPVVKYETNPDMIRISPKRATNIQSLSIVFSTLRQDICARPVIMPLERAESSTRLKMLPHWGQALIATFASRNPQVEQ